MSDEKRKLSRRDFLKFAVPVTVGLAALKYGRKSNDEPPPVPSASIEATKPRVEKYPCGISLIFDTEGIPKAYLLEDGSQHNLDKSQMIETKNKAFSNNESEIALLFRLPDQVSIYYVPNEEKPLTETLPEDIVDNEELRRRELVIVNSPHVQLHIRQGAFEKGELLEYFDGNQGHGMHIVLVDGPDVKLAYLEDERYKSYQNIGSLVELNSISIDVETYKEEELEAAARSINFYRENDPNFLFSTKLKQRTYLDLSQEEWKDLAYTSPKNTRKRNGLHLGKNSFDGNNSVAFISVFKPKVIPYAYITYDENGSVNVERSDFRVQGRGYETYPDLNDTHPSQANIDLAPPSSNYIYSDSNPGFIARHELAHDVESQHNYEGEYSFSEKKTDQRAVASVMRAYQQWKDSGYTDNTGYYLVFSTNEGHILANNRNSITSEQTI